jgi:hypothetical protein
MERIVMTTNVTDHSGGWGSVETAENMRVLEMFMSTAQVRALGAGIRGEEKEYFRAKIAEMAETVRTMPNTYETDGQGNAAIAHLHYFTGAWDWYITERDTCDGPQLQAFGLVHGHEHELGYINIHEITRNRAELDLHWTPKSLAELG